MSKIIYEGKEIHESEITTVGRKIRCAVALSPDEIVLFTNHDHYDEWLLSSSLGERYRKEKVRMKRALEVKEALGESRARQLILDLHGKLEQASRLMRELAGAMPEPVDSQGMTELYQSVLSPRAGSVFFYKDPNFQRSFDEWQGFFHISNPWVGRANNDTFSSIRCGGGITLFEHAWWGGRALTLFGMDIKDLKKSKWAWFDNMMSSYWFWA